MSYNKKDQAAQLILSSFLQPYRTHLKIIRNFSVQIFYADCKWHFCIYRYEICMQGMEDLA